MENKNKTKDILPENFQTKAEAGEFWDTHSTMDYAEYLEPSEDKIEIKKSEKFCQDILTLNISNRRLLD